MTRARRKEENDVWAMARAQDEAALRRAGRVPQQSQPSQPIYFNQTGQTFFPGDSFLASLVDNRPYEPPTMPQVVNVERRAGSSFWGWVGVQAGIGVASTAAVFSMLGVPGAGLFGIAG